jgi:hypothetical protein
MIAASSGFMSLASTRAAPQLPQFTSAIFPPFRRHASGHAIYDNVLSHIYGPRQLPPPAAGMQKSSRLGENSRPHRRSAIVIHLRLVDRNDDSPHGSGAQRCCANPSCNRVFTQSARYLHQAWPAGVDTFPNVAIVTAPQHKGGRGHE